MQLDRLIVECGLASHASEIARLARPAIAIATEQVEQNALDPLDSRFGGLPHLPPGAKWPHWKDRPLAHLATICLSHVAPFDVEHRLPKRGLLSFWYDCSEDQPWGFDPSERGFMRVTYVADESQHLVTLPFPGAAGQNDDDDAYPVFSPCRLAFAPLPTLPNGEWITTHAPQFAHLAKDKRDDALLDNLRELNTPCHRLLGYPELIQGPWELECELVAQNVFTGNVSPELEAAAAKYSNIAQRWRLLLQVDTDEEGPGWMWGDVGTIYFTIPEEDLRDQRFENSWGILQCC